MSGGQTPMLLERERMLAERFDVDRLAVDANDLPSIGDPRGELIALDRGAGPSGERPALRLSWQDRDVRRG